MINISANKDAKFPFCLKLKHNNYVCSVIMYNNVVMKNIYDKYFK